MTERELAERLVLGTAQFGLSYGINNIAGRPTLAQVADLLDTAQAAGLNMLDTAYQYGDSEARLGYLLGGQESQRFKLITKISPAPDWPAEAAIQASLAKLKQPAVAGLLLHSFQHATELTNWAALIAARNTGQAAKIGVSLYHPAEAKWLLDNPEVPCTLIQIPLSVLDQRFLPLLPALTRRGIEIHVRSVFLQGLLLRESGTLPPFFARLAPKLARLRRLAVAADVPLAALLLMFAIQTPGVARIVIGVDSAENLRQNLAAAYYSEITSSLRPALTALAEETTAFTLPYLWPHFPPPSASSI